MQAFLTYTIHQTFVSYSHRGVERQREICSGRDYTAAVCLPGHVSVKLWLSEGYMGDVSSTDTHIMDTV